MVHSQLEIESKNNVFAIDSTVIDLCLNVYSWAKFRKSKAAVKQHLKIKSFWGYRANAVKHKSGSPWLFT